MTLQEHIYKLLVNHKEQRAFSTYFQNQKIWIKLPDYGEKNIWHKVLSLFFWLSKNPLLAPTVVTNPKKSLHNEAKKLIYLKSQGINVPEVLLQSDDFLALSDCGTPLSLLLYQDNISSEEKKHILKLLSLQLASMHNLGIYHSRPALRDITYSDGKIYFLDFEENLEGILDTNQAIIRDALIYIHSIYRKVEHKELVDIALQNYIKNLDKNILNSIQIESTKYTFIHWILAKLHRFLGKDAKAILKTFEFIKKTL